MAKELLNMGRGMNLLKTSNDRFWFINHFAVVMVLVKKQCPLTEKNRSIIKYMNPITNFGNTKATFFHVNIAVQVFFLY